MQEELRSTERFIRSAPPATERELAQRIARLHRADPRRVFLTHGATEANALALLAIQSTLPHSRALRVRVRLPEYPPLLDAVRLLRGAFVPGRTTADVTVASEPNNPTGLLLGDEALEGSRAGTPRLLLDETFREFTNAPPAHVDDHPGLWVSGTFTKVFGADMIRVGYLIVAEEDVPLVAGVQGLLFDEVAPASIAMAVNLLRHRREVLAESRAIFRTNLRALRSHVPDVPALSAPVWLDRIPGTRNGRAFATFAHRAGVLVAPGDLFGAPDGVRVTLTLRSFPRDLEAYLAVRERFVRRGPRSGR
jgi:histidinol-phosphate/aromatic aminotransferase/cobyric acid decarboxylase-like protein